MGGSTSLASPQPDKLLVDIACYTHEYRIDSTDALETARYSLLDALGCAMQALDYPACARLLGPTVPGTVVPDGARLPGTSFRLDPVQAAFDLGAMIRWLDFNDTFLAAEWGHPSDNLGAILMASDWFSRTRVASGGPPLKMGTILEAMVKTHEIQGILSLENSFNRLGFDHVLLVKVASAAVCTWLLGGTLEQTVNALSQAFTDGAPLRLYRHAPNTGSRKSWAAGDAASRAVWLALLSLKGEMGYPACLTTPQWGFQDALFKGRDLTVPRPFGSYVMEHVLFKVSFPAEFHAQTAVECAVRLHPQVRDRLDQVDKVTIRTQESAIRIIDKKGPLHNPADRDHCIQYMTAIGLIFGHLTAADYEDAAASDLRIDTLREKMVCLEDNGFSADYLDPEKRSIANAVQVFFKDGTKTDEVVVEYPLGHPRRRCEGLPLVLEKFKANLSRRFSPDRQQAILSISLEQKLLEELPVNEYVDLYVP